MTRINLILAFWFICGACATALSEPGPNAKKSTFSPTRDTAVEEAQLASARAKEVK